MSDKSQPTVEAVIDQLPQPCGEYHPLPCGLATECPVDGDHFDPDADSVEIVAESDVTFADHVPRTPDDRRPHDEPFYIDSYCPDCESRLVPYDWLDGKTESEKIWWDEWMCPMCRNGVHMDWPDGNESLVDEDDDKNEFIPFEEHRRD